MIDLRRLTSSVRTWALAGATVLFTTEVPAWQLGPSGIGPPDLERISFVLHFDENGTPVYDDPRGSLTMKAKEFGLSDEEVKEIRANTGYVFCEGKDFGNFGVGSGALYGKDGMQVLTNIHVVKDEKGRTREPCYFQNQEIVPTRVRLLMEDRFFRSEDARRLPDDDIAAIRISENIPTAHGLALDPAAPPLSARQSVIMVSSFQRGTSAIPPTEPVVQQCHVMDILPENLAAPTGLFGDCWTTEGASGSVGLIRDKGVLKIKMIHRADGVYSAYDDAVSYSKDYHPYSMADRSYSYAIGIDGELASALEQFASRRH